MIFQSEKKELWRYASKNLTAPVRGTTRQQLLPHRLPHQRLPQSIGFTMVTINYPQPGFSDCGDDYVESSTQSTTTVSTSRQENVSTPPPPYNSVPELDCSMNVTMQDYCLTFHQLQTYSTEGEIETSASATTSEMSGNQKLAPRRSGYSFENTGDKMLVDDYEKLNETDICHLKADSQKKAQVILPQSKIPTNTQVVTKPSTTITTSSSTTSFAATAAKILRNCCGGTFGSSNSVVTITSPSNNNTCSTLNYDHFKSCAINYSANSCSPEQCFSALMKQLKSSQISTLLKAVKFRHDQVIPITPAVSASTTSSQQFCCLTNYQTNCILIRRSEILGEEPYVIACRLFFWRDLKNASQLKRLPICPNERDPVYVCCNPLHWCRILETETVTPPYQKQRMNRFEEKNSQKGINSSSYGSTEADFLQNYSGQPERVCESVTTDGGDHRCSPFWCEVAYWEMAQRVGERFPADTPTINILYDKPYRTSGNHKDNMYLKELIEKRTTPSPDDVQYTRQKIGLGVTLSQETDGVWLYNRSTITIFVYSPTLTESWYRVCRVEPGDCLRSFDKYRAQSLIYPSQFLGVQTGPIDKFSMRISFGKGWGYSYKRPDITLCPCWLEVLFKPQR